LIAVIATIIIVILMAMAVAVFELCMNRSCAKRQASKHLGE